MITTSKAESTVRSSLALIETDFFTVTPKNNNIQYFLEKHEDLETVEVEMPENVDIFKDEFGGVYISYKNKYLDGFYIAKLRKKL